MSIKELVFAALFMGAVFSVSAQDTILTTQSEKIIAKIIEVDIEVVKYKQYNYQEGPTHTIKKTDISSIIYQNGQVTVFEQNNKSKTKNEKSNDKHDFKRHSFEYDLTFSTSTQGWSPAVEMGFGWLCNATRYFAWDILHLHVSSSLMLKNYDIENLELSLWTGPKVYFVPVTEKIVPFLALRYGARTTVVFKNMGHSIAPELGIKLTRSFYLSVIYIHTWSKYKTVERYQSGTNRIYLSSIRQYATAPVYSNRTVTKTTSGGEICLRFGFDF
jgi:hypothetical protein